MATAAATIIIPVVPRRSSSDSKMAGVKVSAVVLNTPLVTDATVAQWFTSSMTPTSTGNAGGPASLNVLPTAELSAILTHPGA